MKTYWFEGKHRSREEMVAIFEQDRELVRLQMTHALIKGKRNTLLDVGCGAGYTAEFYKDRYTQFVGTDIIASNIALAKEFFPASNRTFLTDNIFTTKRIPKNHFDYVLLLETIEHVDNPFDFISQAASFLKEGGHVVISTPNAVSLTNILWNFKHRNRIIRSYDFDGTETDHLYAWDKQTLQNLLTKIGLRVTDVQLSKSTIRGGQSIIIKAQKVAKRKQ